MSDVIGSLLAKKRVRAVLPYVRGRLLDIGCGRNLLVKIYGNGIGVDVYDWPGIDLLVQDSSKLPFNDSNFSTITIIAALNHIPNRAQVITECFRLLSSGGLLIITMISPGISFVWHKLRSPWDADQKLRKMKEGEVYGLTYKEVIDLVSSGGLKLALHKRFMLGLNSLYVFSKE